MRLKFESVLLALFIALFVYYILKQKEHFEPIVKTKKECSQKAIDDSVYTYVVNELNQHILKK